MNKRELLISRLRELEYEYSYHEVSDNPNQRKLDYIVSEYDRYLKELNLLDANSTEPERFNHGRS